MSISSIQHIDDDLKVAFSAAIATLPTTTYVSRANIEDALDTLYQPFVYHGLRSDNPHMRWMITIYVMKVLGWKKRSNRHTQNPVYVRPLE